MTLKLEHSAPYASALTSAIVTVGTFDGHAATLINPNAMTTLCHPLAWQHIPDLSQLSAQAGSRQNQNQSQSSTEGESGTKGLSKGRQADRAKKRVVITQSLTPKDLNLIQSVFGSELILVLITTEPFKSYGHLLAEVNSSPIGIDHIVAAGSPHGMLREIKLIVDSVRQSNPIASLAEFFFGNLQTTQRYEIGQLESRQTTNQAVLKFAESVGMSQMGCRNIFGISEELLMNAMIDAPREAQTRGITGREKHKITLRCGFDGSVFFISAEDPYGSLRRNTFYRYVGKTLLRHNPDQLLDTKADGAGIGIVRILSGCHGLICRVKKGYRTEVMAMIDSKEHLRDLGAMARSIHFYSEGDS